MKKLLVILLIATFTFTSCGARRYKCGPYRKCEAKEMPTKQDIISKNQVNIKTYHIV